MGQYFGWATLNSSVASERRSQTRVDRPHSETAIPSGHLCRRGRGLSNMPPEDRGWPTEKSDRRARPTNGQADCHNRTSCRLVEAWVIFLLSRAEKSQISLPGTEFFLSLRCDFCVHMKIIVPVSRSMIEHVVSQSQEETAPYLYAGKMGYAVTLFGLSRTVNDEQLAEVAFLLLQQSLAASSQYVGFEQGLSGLGYGLLHLIETEQVEADFMELFGDKIEVIQRSLEKIEFCPMELLSQRHMPLFLHRLLPYIENKSWAEETIKKIVQGVELYLSLQLNDWCEIDYIGNKTFVLQTIQDYMKIVYAIDYPCPSHVLLERYCQLYLNHHLPSSLAVGAYLYHLSEKQNHSLYQDVAILQLHYGSQKSLSDHCLLLNLIDDLQALHLTQTPHNINLEIYKQYLAQIPIWSGNSLLKYINYIIQPNYLF